MHNDAFLTEFFVLLVLLSTVCMSLQYSVHLIEKQHSR